MNIRWTATALIASFGFGACVKSNAPPEPTPQVAVAFGTRILLTDRTLGNLPLHCKLGGIVDTTGTSTTIGGAELGDVREAHNCYVNVTSAELLVDVIETTNDLFQLCVDSGVCEKPDPSNVEKDQICSDTDQFGSCPAVSVQQFEAERFCEFVGRRLPTGVEQVMMRQQNMPQTYGALEKFPTGNQAPEGSCPNAILQGCDGPKPMTIAGADGTGAEGAAKADRTTAGVFDLTGNAAEWSRDLIPAIRPVPLDSLPWFCERPLPTRAANEPPQCPADEFCIHGRYDPDGDGPLPVREDYAICVASRTLSITNGQQGSVFGGNYKNASGTDDEAGVFARTIVNEPDKDPADAKFGFRCVGEAGNPALVIKPRRGDDIPFTADAGGGDVGGGDVGGGDGTIMDAGALDTGTSSTSDAGVMDTGSSTTADAG